jgi:hypothetical protein
MIILWPFGIMCVDRVKSSCHRTPPGKSAVYCIDFSTGVKLVVCTNYRIAKKNPLKVIMQYKSYMISERKG